ncbi:MAG: phosphatase PAP2 family protein [Patescibacteria group bacterium]
MWLRKFPLELYCIVVPAVLFLLFIFFDGSKNTVPLSGDLIVLLSVFIASIACYVVLKSLWLVAHKHSYNVVVKLVVSGIVLVGIVSLELVTLALSTLYLFAHQSVERVTEISNWYMMLDKKIFGVYPAFFIHSISYPVFLEMLIVYSYHAAFLLLLGVLVFAFCMNKKVFRILILSIFISHVLGYACWALWPSIAPSEMYRLNILNAPISSDIQASVENMKLSENLTQEIDKIDSFWIDPAGKLLSVSTNPSMHIVWAILVLYAAMSLWRPSGYILVPWFILNMLGTLFTIQHYGIDIIAGLVLGVATVYIVQKLLRYEERIKPYNYLYIADELKQDIKNIYNYILFK